MWVPPLEFPIKITNTDKNNTVVPGHLFLEEKPPYLLIHKHALFYNLFQL
jgi:hypothetical protein